MSSFKRAIERIRAQETEQNLQLEIEELKCMTDVKAKLLESKISVPRDEVKSLRVLLSGENLASDLMKNNRSALSCALFLRIASILVVSLLQQCLYNALKLSLLLVLE